MNFLSTDYFRAQTETFSSRRTLYTHNNGVKTRPHLQLSGITTLLLATAGLSLSIPKAVAQEVRRTDDGQVVVDKNAFDLETGPLGNTSNIPLPSGLPTTTTSTTPIEVDRTRQAPATIELTPNSDYVYDTLTNTLNTTENTSYTVQPNTLQMTTEFMLERSVGSHLYAEGIEVTVFKADGTQTAPETRFVAGDQVTQDLAGQALNDKETLSVTYGENDIVQVRVLNLRPGETDLKESGVYFTQGGEIIVEDDAVIDLDFEDNRTTLASTGTADAIKTEITLTADTTVVETPLDPEVRQEEVVESDEIQAGSEIETAVSETRDWGGVRIPRFTTNRLGHARGIRTENDEQLIYNRYASAGQIRTGSDGLTLTGQLSPLINNPKAPPTLVTGTATFDPTVDDNEAGLVVDIGVVQFLNRTHRLATNMFGNVIESPTSNSPTFIEPTGWLNNRRLVGYVPVTESTERNQTLTSINGIFNLPADQAVTIMPADAERVGRGNAAYTKNVGGLIVEKNDGSMVFLPQWNETSYAQAPMVLAAGEATRIIYALVPQQPGQALKIGQTYAVGRHANGYKITDGGFTIISADQQPENFRSELAEVYAVEDTLASGNAVTERFDGTRGTYTDIVSGTLVSTVDLDLADEVDARVGNQLLAAEIIAGEAGQAAHYKTTRAGGFYLGGSLAAGIGNQRDTVSRTTSTAQLSGDAIRTRRILNTYETPRTQVDTIATGTSQTTTTSGTIAFEVVDSDGTLRNISFTSTDTATITNEPVNGNVTSSVVNRGTEVLTSSTVLAEDIQAADGSIVEMDQATTTETDSYPNVSPALGKLALGMVYNFGNTPWTAAANTIRAELFAGGIAFGRSNDDLQAGWLAEAIFHPFGEQQRDAYQYDAEGNIVALYKTEPVVDANGQQVMETVTNNAGEAVEVAVNQFVTDEAGNRIAQTVGTGRAKGPGMYVRIEDRFEDDDEMTFAGGVQFTF